MAELDKRQRRHCHAHRLFHQLGNHIGFHPPLGQKASPQRPCGGDKRQTGCKGAQAQFGPGIVEKQPRHRISQQCLGRHGGGTEQQAGGNQPPQRGRHAPAAGQALGRQTGGRHIDPCRCEGHKNGIDRKDQLVKAHAFRAQPCRQEHPERHAQQPQHQSRSRQQRCVFEVGLSFHSTSPFPPFPDDRYSAVGKNMACRAGHPMVKSMGMIRNPAAGPVQEVLP